jgi:transcriptional regulator with XRE-family HTH domain
MSYHYGQTIREYREKKHLTIAQLAELWPNEDNTGVTRGYVSDIERGVKHISDVSLLRSLAKILDIPLWKFGLSDYNPFSEEIDDSAMDLDTLEELIQDLWLVRQSVPFTLFENKVTKLLNIFKKKIFIYPNIKNNKSYLMLWSHSKRLEETVYTEKHNYTQALMCAKSMLELATLSGDKKAQAIAYTRVGVELLRDDDKGAMDYLIRACDMALSLSKELRAYCFAMLARAYAQFGNQGLFEKYINVAVNCGSSIAGRAVAYQDYIFHAYSAILEEKSNGYILFGEGEKALKSLSDVEREIRREHNSYLDIWIPLDYAQSYMLLENVEGSLNYLQVFYENALEYQSDRLISRVIGHLNKLEVKGYGNVPVVKDFEEMIRNR